MRLILSKHNAFTRLSAESQFDICCTVCIIAVQTARHDLTKVKHFGFDSKEVFEYSIYDGYNEIKNK